MQPHTKNSCKQLQHQRFSGGFSSAHHRRSTQKHQKKKKQTKSLPHCSTHQRATLGQRMGHPHAKQIAAGQQRSDGVHTCLSVLFRDTGYCDSSWMARRLADCSTHPDLTNFRPQFVPFLCATATFSVFMAVGATAMWVQPRPNFGEYLERTNASCGLGFRGKGTEGDGGGRSMATVLPPQELLLSDGWTIQ